MVEEYEASVADRLKLEETETNAKYEELIRNIPNEKKIQKILAKQGESAWRQAITEREKELTRQEIYNFKTCTKLIQTASNTLKRHSGSFISAAISATPLKPIMAAMSWCLLCSWAL